jgi:hypothetical protein
MEQKIKNTLPNFNINNSSNRNFEELMRITELCHKINNILVFIKRNKKNNDYFKMIETTQNTKEINLIFLNKDDIYHYYIENNNNLDIAIMSLKRKLYNETECVVCMEPCNNKFYICSTCGHQIHGICLSKCVTYNCSICKNNSFMYND